MCGLHMMGWWLWFDGAVLFGTEDMPWIFDVNFPFSGVV